MHVIYPHQNNQNRFIALKMPCVAPIPPSFITLPSATSDLFSASEVCLFQNVRDLEFYGV